MKNIRFRQYDLTIFMLFDIANQQLVCTRMIMYSVRSHVTSFVVRSYYFCTQLIHNVVQQYNTESEASLFPKGSDFCRLFSSLPTSVVW